MNTATDVIPCAAEIADMSDPRWLHMDSAEREAVREFLVRREHEAKLAGIREATHWRIFRDYDVISQEVFQQKVNEAIAYALAQFDEVNPWGAERVNNLHTCTVTQTDP